MANLNEKSAALESKTGETSANSSSKGQIENPLKDKAIDSDKENSKKSKAIETAKANVEKTKTAYELAKKALYALTGKTEKSSEPKGPGVIETIFEIVSKANEKGVSKKAILAKLTAKFPDRAVEGMSKTINVQLPKRMSKERKVTIEKLDSGNFYMKVKVAKVKKAA